MGLGSVLNNMIFKRTSTFAVAVAGGAFFFDRTFEVVTEYVFDKYNEGVCKNR